MSGQTAFEDLQALVTLVRDGNYLTRGLIFRNSTAHIVNALSLVKLDDAINHAAAVAQSDAHALAGELESRGLLGESSQLNAARAKAIKSAEALRQAIRSAPSSEKAKALGL